MMNSKSEWILVGVVVAIAMISLGGWMASQIRERAWIQATIPTLLNGGFEGTFNVWNGIGEIRAPAGWTPYWLEGNPPAEESQGPLARYEMTPMYASQYPYRVHSGEQSVRWFTFYKVHQGGLYQRVRVTPGQWYSLSVEAHAWCSNGENPRVSDQEIYASLGIDPDGQTDARRRGVVWTPWAYIGAEWQEITSEPVQAQGEYITVYIETWNKWRVKHADAYIDDAALKVVDLGAVCPTPEPCPTGEPCEPYPTAIPCPTAVPCNGNCDLELFRSIIREELRALTVEIK